MAPTLEFFCAVLMLLKMTVDKLYENSLLLRGVQVDAIQVPNNQKYSNYAVSLEKISHHQPV